MTREAKQMVNAGEMAIKIAKELVRIPSLSGREKEAAYYIRDTLNGLGVDSIVIDELGNVIAKIEGSSSKNPIILEGHIDHVEPGSKDLWKVDPYSGKIIDNKLYGRGAVDMKSSLASMISSITLLPDNMEKTVYLVFVTHEETAEGVAFKHALENTIREKPYIVVLGEATNLNVYIGHRGRCLIKYVVQGKTAHASMPHLGLNALSATSKSIVEILETFEKNKLFHEKLGYSTLTPTVIECSPKVTPQIPDSCRVIFDRRILPFETENALLQVFYKVKALLEHEGFKIKVSILTEELKFWTGKTVKVKDFFKPWILDEKNMHVKKALKTIRTNVNPNATVGYWKFSTDGVYSAGEKGYVTIGFGPGNENLAHQPNEHVPLKHIKKATYGYASLVLTFQ